MKQMGEEKVDDGAGFLKTVPNPNPNPDPSQVPLLAPLTDSQRSAVAHLMDELAYKVKAGARGLGLGLGLELGLGLASPSPSPSPSP